MKSSKIKPSKDQNKEKRKEQYVYSNANNATRKLYIYYTNKEKVCSIIDVSNCTVSDDENEQQLYGRPIANENFLADCSWLAAE